MRCRAVIGASYGDEGKGRTVDWLAAQSGGGALALRSNGGAQAAHTVVRDDGARHVFHHFGSASMRGVRTHLSRFTVAHPIVFADELMQLQRLGIAPSISADPRGFVTTPWDMMVNQAVECARGGDRHGSCGLGFGETIERCEAPAFSLTVADLYEDDLPTKLRAIRDQWLPLRLEALELPDSAGPLEHAASEGLLTHFVEQCALFTRKVRHRADADIGLEQDVIFEAAQGLLLDQNAPGFPYLTRSNTGMANIAALAAEAGIPEVAPIYVTRCYLTRHGRGPMEDERPIARWYDVDDPTNRPNPWQESLRFGLLDPLALGQRIRADLASAKIRCQPSLVVSCLDQAAGDFAWIEQGSAVTGPSERLIAALVSACAMPLLATFSSPVNDFSANKMQYAY